ncbi:hypothetical protein LPJ64_000401 [Coemansia asiatica]|uniref:Uncharacterized protein n=1 Tax=Coemansia asiatica TaxID=1052880 RepID=A0A9W7XR21_9FUNG|nr:hypothetical protein LPJ64_000401 [Coemansia asiatica]
MIEALNQQPYDDTVSAIVLRPSTAVPTIYKSAALHYLRLSLSQHAAQLTWPSDWRDNAAVSTPIFFLEVGK